jgi:Sortase domain
MARHRRLTGSVITVLGGGGAGPRARRPAVAVVLASAAALLLLGVVDSREHSFPALGYPPGRGPISGVRGSGTPGPGSGTPEPGSAQAVGSFDRPARPAAAPGFEVGRLPSQLLAPGGSPPVRLTVPAIGVETPLLRLGLEPDRSMQVPEDFGRAGWFAEGPAPGQPGPAVIAGHVDSKTGPAVFYRLRELRAGDQIRITTADGARLRFEVDRTQSFPKTSFPTDAVFGPTPGAELRLVTCAGTFDRARGSYRDNLVVFARLEQRATIRD